MRVSRGINRLIPPIPESEGEMNKTSIEWVKNPDGTQGYTWNPITGCLNNCAYCYARKLANGRLKSRYLANENIAPIGTMIVGAAMGEKALKDPFYPRFWEDRLWDLPIEEYAEPRGIFVCDMSDLFGNGIPEEWTKKVFDRMWWGKQHRFYLLTKQPQNLIKFSPFPDNCWVGVTATGPEMFIDALANLKQVEAKVKYISVEPYLIKMPGRFIDDYGWWLDWLIIGSQTKPYRPPTTESVQEIVQACDKAGMPVFLKENLKPLLRQNNHNIYSFPKWAGKQFAVTSDHSLAPSNPYPNEPMRSLRQEVPK